MYKYLPLSLLILWAPLFAKEPIQYNWKLGAYLSPKMFDFTQKSPTLEDAAGSAIITQNIQLIFQKKWESWILESGVNFSNLDLKTDDSTKQVSIYTFHLGAYYRNLIIQLQKDKFPIIDGSSGEVHFDDFNSWWATAGYRNVLLLNELNYFFTLGYLINAETPVGTVQSSSGYRLSAGLDYRYRFSPSWDFFARPFLDYKSVDFELKNTEDSNTISIIEYGLRVGINKFF